VPVQPPHRFKDIAPSVGALQRSSSTPLFEQLASRIEALIQAGTLSVGEQAPSVRRAQKQFGVSAATVIEAYRLLEARGVIRARPQSGYFVRQSPVSERRVPAMTAPALRSVSLEPPEPMLVRLKAAVPDESLLPTTQLGRLLGKVYRDHPEALSTYGPTAGCTELRREIARRMIDAGCVVSPDDIVVTNGTTEAVYLALQILTGPGDTVAVESPTYHGLLDTLRARGLKVLPLASCTVNGVCVDAIEEAIRSRRFAAMVLIPNFSNPLGGVLPDERKRWLVELAAANEIPVIEDDIYGELGFEGPRPRALRSYDDGGWVVYCSSFSKVLSPGIRIGWCVPGRHMDAYRRIKHDLNISAPMGPQLAVAEFLSGGGYDKHLRQLRRFYQTQTARFSDRILATFPEGTSTSQPRGGHVIWVEMPVGVDSVALLEVCQRRGITFAPGPLFAPGDAYRNFLRLNCAVAWSEELSDAIATIGRLAKEQLHAAQAGPDGRARPKRSMAL